MQVVTIVGARPQFIKAAVVSRALRAAPGVTERIVHTGQHYDENLSDIFFRELDIPAPDHNLGIGSGSHGAQTGRMLSSLEAVLQLERPDWVLVYGDTNSTLAGALAAAKLGIRTAHVEAGLRSFNRAMPEEINRVLTDHAADLLFAPSPLAAANLQWEGIPASRVREVGDVMYDAALHFGAVAEQHSQVLDQLGLAPDGYILATVHRAANTDDPQRLGAIVGGLVAMAPQLPVVFPVHPRTRQALDTWGLRPAAQRSLRLIEPVGYLDMIRLAKQARLIATDSGGLQKEAYYLRTPSVTLREETEWVELLTQGWTRLVPPTSAAAIADGIRAALKETPGEHGEVYGDGTAAVRIVQALDGR